MGDSHEPSGIRVTELVRIIASIQIACASGKPLFDQFFCELFEYEKRNPKEGAQIAEMLGGGLFKQYKEFVADEEVATDLGKALLAHQAHTARPEDERLCREFLESSQRPGVVERVRDNPEYFNLAWSTRKRVFDEWEKMRLGWKHPGSPTNAIIAEINRGLTRALISGMEKAKAIPPLPRR